MQRGRRCVQVGNHAAYVGGAGRHAGEHAADDAGEHAAGERNLNFIFVHFCNSPLFYLFQLRVAWLRPLVREWRAAELLCGDRNTCARS